MADEKDKKEEAKAPEGEAKAEAKAEKPANPDTGKKSAAKKESKPKAEKKDAAAKKDSKAPFADAGASLERLLAAGANRRDISLAARFAIYEAVFSLLYMLDDPGVDDNDVFMLQESLLGTDPSGKEGRPGSAP